MHLWSIHWVFHMIFAHSNFDVFRPKKKELKQRRGLEIWLPHRNFDPPDLPKGPIPTEKGAKRSAIPSFERRKGPRACIQKTNRGEIARFVRHKARKLTLPLFIQYQIGTMTGNGTRLDHIIGKQCSRRRHHVEWRVAYYRKTRIPPLRKSRTTHFTSDSAARHEITYQEGVGPRTRVHRHSAFGGEGEDLVPGASEE